MKCIYENKINEIGALANTFLADGILILFGNEAPDTLKDYCYSIDILKATEKIQLDHILWIDNYAYKILAVGDVAQQNLECLGHLTISFSGEQVASMPGTIVVEKAEVPTIQIGSTVRIMEAGMPCD